MDKNSVGICFVVTYYTHLKNVSKIIKKHIKRLYADPSCFDISKRGENHMQKNLHDHFLNEDHDDLLNNVEITLIDKTDPSDTEIGKEFYRAKLRTLAPLSLNIEE